MNNNLIRTPCEKIAIGERVKTKTGEPAIKIKKPNKNKFEIIPISKFIEMIITK